MTSSVQRSQISSAASASGQYWPYPRLMARIVAGPRSRDHYRFRTSPPTFAPLDSPALAPRTDPDMRAAWSHAIGIIAFFACATTSASQHTDAGVVIAWNERVLSIAKAEDKLLTLKG